MSADRATITLSASRLRLSAIGLLLLAIGMYVGLRVTMDMYTAHIVAVDRAGQRAVELERTLVAFRGVDLAQLGTYPRTWISTFQERLARSIENFQQAHSCAFVLPTLVPSRSEGLIFGALALADLFFGYRSSSGTSTAQRDLLEKPGIVVQTFPATGSHVPTSMSLWDYGRAVIQESAVITSWSPNSTWSASAQQLSLQFVTASADTVGIDAMQRSLDLYADATLSLVMMGKIIFPMLCGILLVSLVLICVFVFRPAVFHIQEERNRIVRVFGLIPAPLIRNLARQRHDEFDEEASGLVLMY
jgi:hypothetical protein